MVPRETLFVPFPVVPASGEGAVALEGTDGAAPVKSDEFKFKSAGDSNVVVKVTGSGSGTPRIEIGVYYV